MNIVKAAYCTHLKCGVEPRDGQFIGANGFLVAIIYMHQHSVGGRAP